MGKFRSKRSRCRIDPNLKSTLDYVKKRIIDSKGPDVENPLLEAALLDSGSAHTVATEANVANLIKQVVVGDVAHITDLDAYERALAALAALVVRPTALATSLVPHTLNSVIKACGQHSSSSIDSIRLRSIATGCLSAILKWSDDCVFKRIESPEAVIRCCVSGFFCTIKSFQDAMETGDHLDMHFAALTNSFYLFSGFCKYGPLGDEILTLWGSRSPGSGDCGPPAADNFASIIMAFASGLVDGTFKRTENSAAAYEAFTAAVHLCVSLWHFCTTKASEQNKEPFLSSTLRDSFHCLCTAKLSKNAGTSLKHECPPSDSSCAVVFRTWTATLADLLVTLVETGSNATSRVELLTCTVPHLARGLSSSAFSHVRETVTRIGSVDMLKKPLGCSTPASVSTTDDKTVSTVLQNGERLDDEQEVLAARECQRLIKATQKELDLNSYSFDILNRIFEPITTTQSQMMDDADDVEPVFYVPEEMLVLLQDASVQTPLVDICHGAIAAALQLPDLCTAAASSFDTEIWDLIKTHIAALRDPLRFLTQCILATNIPITSPLRLNSSDIVSGPIRSLFSIVRALEVTATAPPDIHLYLVDTLEVLAQTAAAFAQHFAVTDTTSIVSQIEHDLPNLAWLLHQTACPHVPFFVNANKDVAVDNDFINASWREAQFHICQLFTTIVAKTRTRSILQVALTETLKLMEFSLNDDDDRLLLACSAADLLFEAFADEQFDDLFKEMSALPRLIRLSKKLKVMARRSTALDNDDRYAVDGAITNLEAFINYKRAHL